MLYDPKWETPAIVSLPSLIAWLETKPAKQSYVYFDCRGACLYSLYLMALRGDPGLDWDSPVRDEWTALHNAPFFEIARTRKWTFGAALERARAALSSTDRTNP